MQKSAVVLFGLMSDEAVWEKNTIQSRRLKTVYIHTGLVYVVRKIFVN